MKREIAMLYRLELENFYSIRDKQVLDLSIDNSVVDDENRFVPIFRGSEKRAPKVIAIFGANASGKSTLLRALDFIIHMVTRSVDASGIWAMPFNDEHSASSPIRLAIEFGGFMEDPKDFDFAKIDKIPVELFGVFRYELEVEVEDGFPKKIALEALRKKPLGKGWWQRVFERDSEGNVKGSPSFRITGFKHLIKTLGQNHSVLSSFAKFNHPVARRYVEAVSRVLFVMDSLHSTPEESIVNLLNQQSGQFENLRREIGRIDVGIEDVKLQEMKDGPPQLRFKHRGLKHEMGLDFESKGTRTFIKVLPIIHYVLEDGSLAVIDEIDDSIHPNLLPEIIRWFYDFSRNPRSSQLWFTSHAVSLLEHLKKEEIVICEKDREGRTAIFSLMDVKSLRRDDNHYRKYVDGVYGGVPSIG
jgi:uncharacterized protein